MKKNISPQTSSTFPNSNVAARQETKITETNNNVIKKDSELSSSSEDNNKHDSNEDHTFYEKPSKVTRIAKKNFTKKSNENNDDLQELTKAAINICNHLQSDSISNENVSSKSAEQAFAEFVTFSLQRMEESERSIRRNKIFENLTAPKVNENSTAQVASDNQEEVYSFIANKRGDSKTTSHWYLDSGATEHLASDDIPLVNLEKLSKPITINVAKSGIYMQANQVGELNVTNTVNGKTNQIIIREVLLVKNLTYNLLSVRKLETNGFEVLFTGGKGIISKGNKVIAIATI